MPNYSFVVDATYDPLSYAEIAAPIKEAAAFHSALQDKYDDMRMTSEMYDRFIDKDDVKSRAMYDEYMKTLNGAADTLMRNGAWGQRSVFSNARESYSRNMMPIQLGYQKRAQEAAAQQQAKAKNPLLEFSHDATSSGLDWYLDNPNGGFHTIDPITSAASVGEIAKAWSKRLADDPEGAGVMLKSLGLDDAYIEIIKTNGWSPDRILNYRQDPLMRSIVNTVLKSQGMAGFDDNGNPLGNDMWDSNVVSRVGDFASQGLAQGVGTQDVQVTPNPYALQAMKNAGKGSGSGSGSSSNPANAGYNIAMDDEFALTDELTDQGYADKLQNAAAMNHIHFDKDSGQFVYDPNRSFSTSVGMGADALQGFISDSIPFRDSYQEITDQIAKDNGWTRIAAPSGSSSFLRNMGMGIAETITGREISPFIDKNGKAVPLSEVAKAYNTLFKNVAGSYHTVQDVSLTDYNNAFKGLGVFEVKKKGKDGKFVPASDKAVPISSILSDKEMSNVQVGVDTHAGTEGLVLKVTKGNKPSYYYIDAESISQRGIKSAVSTVQSAAQYRQQLMKQYGLTNETWWQAVNVNPTIYEAQIRYKEAVDNLRGVIGRGVTAPDVSLGSTY